VRLKNERRKEMNKKVLLATFAFLFLAIRVMPLAGSEVAEKEIPIVSQSFASKEIRPGEAWKVYLNAAHPNGEMTNIFAEVYQPGVGQYPISIIRIKPENPKELSGYIYLPTSTSWHLLNFVNLVLTVYVQDRAGNFSAPVAFPLSISTRFSQEAPPQGVFQEQDLGPVMLRLRTRR
jgi:hypothetical protein